METLVVCKKFSFDAAHKLPNYKGKCSNLHGHHWELEVEVEGSIDPKTGMIVDFAIVDMIVKNHLIPMLDHTYLNDRLENPTAELIIAYCLGILQRIIPDSFKLSRLRLYETPNSFAEWRS